MSVTAPQFADKESYLGQIDKLTHSHALRKAESLCKLLRYLADHALTQPGVALKEYQIATEVFGRSNDFDPQADSAIRVQAGRLRLKLLDYYSHEGLADTILVEMPNGSYTINFQHREPPAPVAVPVPPRHPAPVEILKPRKGNRRWIIAVTGLSLALAAALAGVAILSMTLHSARTGKESESATSESGALHTFWSQFASGPEAPWVIFSNAAFVGRPETGMRYLNPARDSGDLILDHYTGVGEVLAVHELDRVFNLLNHPIDVKRGSLFTLDDAKKADLIFVGSPAENLTLLDLPGSQEFIFKRLASSPHKGDLGIVNVHPEPGQPTIFYPSNSSQPLTEDYAIVALVPGLNPDRHVIILAGTTTIGTQAAVEYVCEKESVEELLRSLGVQPGGDVKPFEALLRVKVTRGVPVGVQLVAVRNRQ
ncbi:MAG: hypothetical protein LAO30_03920 [Acidobacteriia bacterium]|nr:hypothetical protein [Terriglobia bacterium]